MRNVYVRRYGFTLVELLVVIAIVGIMASMLLPAIQGTRERARIFSCESKLMQLGLAVRTYEQLHGYLPAGSIEMAGPIRSVPRGYHHNWISSILPVLDQSNMYRAIDYSKSVYDPIHHPPLRSEIEALRCPSDPMRPVGMSGIGLSNYAGCHHDGESPIDTTNNGLFFLNSHLRVKDVPDGLSCTLLIGEKTQSMYDLGWMSGTRATLRNANPPISVKLLRSLAAAKVNITKDGSSLDDLEYEMGIVDEKARANLKNESIITGFQLTELSTTTSASELEVYSATGYLSGFNGVAIAPLEVGGFASYHVGGFNMMTGDGNTRFWNNQTDPIVLKQLANRNDGLPLSVPE